MQDFEDSTTLWRISEFERMRMQSGASGFQHLAGPTVLSSTLLADLNRIDHDTSSLDPLELIAACVRHREAVLVYLQHEGLVWPVTLFPQQMLYHSPRPIELATAEGLANLRQMGIEPAGLRPPGDFATERIGRADHYHPLVPLLWALATLGPRRTLLREIGGTAAYRLLPDRLPEGLVAGGALGSAIDKMRQHSVSLKAIASWPGMNVERASRLINGLYLFSALIVTRSTGAAREQPASDRRGLLDFFRPRR